MDDEIEQLVVQVRADTQGFARDVATLRTQIDGPLSDGLSRAGRTLEAGLLGALRRGSLGFEDLRRIALAALSDIADAAIRAGLGELGAGGEGGGGLFSLGASLIGALLGAPGRATGGPVGPGRAYLVGERGPELFVPTSSGTIRANGVGGGDRTVNVTISLAGAARSAPPEALRRSAGQIGRDVRRALAEDAR